MMNDDGLVTYLLASRLCRNITPDGTALRLLNKSVNLVRDALQVDFQPVGEDCLFMALSSVQCTFEMVRTALGAVVILDCSLIEFLCAINALRFERLSGHTHIRIGADLLGLASMKKADFVGALYYNSLKQEFSGISNSPKSLSDNDVRLPSLQVTFMVLHEIYHWSLSKSESMRRTMDEFYRSGFSEYALDYIKAHLSPESLRKSVPKELLTDSTIELYGSMRVHCQRWLIDRQEEVMCDLLAMQGLLMGTPSPAYTEDAILAGATVPAFLELLVLADELANYRNPVSNAASGSVELEHQVRFFVFAAIANAAAIGCDAKFSPSRLRKSFANYMHRGTGRVATAMSSVYDSLRRNRTSDEWTSIEQRGRRSNRESACLEFEIVPDDIPFYRL